MEKESSTSNREKRLLDWFLKQFDIVIVFSMLFRFYLGVFSLLCLKSSKSVPAVRKSLTCSYLILILLILLGVYLLLRKLLDSTLHKILNNFKFKNQYVEIFFKKFISITIAIPIMAIVSFSLFWGLMVIVMIFR